MLSRFIISCSVAVLMPTMAAAQGMTILNPDGPYTQAATGMVFPESVGELKRVSIIQYKPDGTDESAGYNRAVPMQEIVATVYIFPSPNLTSIGSPQAVIDSARQVLCQSQFRAIESEVAKAHPDAGSPNESAATLVQGAASYSGYKAEYSMTAARFADRTNVALHSYAFAFCFLGGKWTAEYRIDYPAGYDGSQTVSNFMRDLTLTIPPEK
jgi:hypothetical protein